MCEAFFSNDRPALEQFVERDSLRRERVDEAKRQVRSVLILATYRRPARLGEPYC